MSDKRWTALHQIMAYGLQEGSKAASDLARRWTQWTMSWRHAWTPRPPADPAPAPDVLSEAPDSRLIWDADLADTRSLVWVERTTQRRQRWRSQADVSRRRWLVLGAAGGVGTSTVVAALARYWARTLTLRVGVVDASPTGGYLPLAFGRDPVDTGWDQLHNAAVVSIAQSWGRRHWLIPRSVAGSAQADVRPVLMALAAAPADVWIVDGGTDWALLHDVTPDWDAVVGVVRPDMPAVRAVAAALRQWQAHPRFLGTIVVQQRPGEALSDTDSAETTWPPWPADAAGVDRLWQGRGIPASGLPWLTAVSQVAFPELLQIAEP